MEKDVFARIEELMPELSKGQKKLGEYILHSYEKVLKTKAETLGEIVGVSESTVVRFAVSLGYEGYPEFQKALEKDSLKRMNSLQRMEFASYQLGEQQSVLNAVLQSDIKKIKETIAEIDEETFSKAVDSICIAKKVYVVGIRSCAPLASFLAFYLNLMFDDVVLLETNNPSELFEQMIHMDVRDVLVAISFPRYSISTQRACEFAQKCKAKVITITDSVHTPLTPYSDYTITAKSDMASIVDSLVAPLSVINALVVAISMKKQEEISETFKKLESLWDKYDFYNQEDES